MLAEFLLLYITVLLLGLVVGSFLNVVIHRFGTGVSVVHPPSRCPHCQTRLKVWDLIPVFSFLMLRRRCRYCAEPLSYRYLVVELLTGAVFLLAFHYFGPTLLLFKNLVIFLLLLVIGGIDLERKVIPNSLVLTLFAWGLLWQIFYPALPWSAALAGGLVGGGGFLLIALISRGGMGGGDIKLMAALGFVAGWPAVLGVFLLSFCAGAAVGAVLMLAGRKSRKSLLPFGPFIALGFTAVVLWGEQLWRWYLNLLL